MHGVRQRRGRVADHGGRRTGVHGLRRHRSSRVPTVQRCRADPARDKNSSLSAVVVRFSRARNRYERQGILVAENALERAEQQCPADEESRARRRDRDAVRRAHEDLELQARMAVAIGKLFPGCPPGGPRRSPDTPRSAAAAGWDAPPPAGHWREALELAVLASVRHQDTGYDELLMSGVDRATARDHVRDRVNAVLDEWRHP